MGGKASLLLVIAFSTIFLVMGINISRSTVDSEDNIIDYYTKIELNNNVRSINQFALLQVINALNTQKYIPGETGTFKTKIGNYDFDVSTTEAVDSKVGINYRINILAKGENGSFKYDKSTNYYIFRSNLQDYAYFSNNEGGNIWFGSGDVISGKFYVNDNLRITGSPVFYERAYHAKDIITDSWGGKPNPDFKKGEEKKIIEFPAVQNLNDFKSKASAGGALISGQKEVFLKFEKNIVKIKYNKSTLWTDVSVTQKKISDFAPNGCICAENAALYVEGEVEGNLSIGATGNNDYVRSDDASLKYGIYDFRYKTGTVYISNDITVSGADENYYKDEYSPNKNAIALISQQSVFVEDNPENRKGDINIHAMVYAQTGGFGVHNVYKYSSNLKKIKLRGGITQGVRQVVKSGGLYGFDKDYVYDERMRYSIQLPFFPVLNSFSYLTKNEGLLKTLK